MNPLPPVSNPRLLREILESRKKLQLPVAGSSMLPCMRSGDVATIVSREGACRMGDVIVRVDQAKPVIHRVVWVSSGDGPSVLVTKGDCSRHLDPVCGIDDLLGSVESISRGNRICFLNGGGLDKLAEWLARLTAKRFRLGQRFQTDDLRREIELDTQVMPKPSLTDLVLRGLILSVRSIHGMVFRVRMKPYNGNPESDRFHNDKD